VTAPITAERLAEIEARANAATPGPWHAEHRGVMAEGVEIVDDCAVAGWDVYPENQAFIAHARADVPDLVAEVRRLTAALAAHARHTDAAIDGVRAMLPAALEIARREGAEAMRERAAQACIDEEVRAHDDRAGVVQNPHRQLVDLAAQEGRARAACTLRFRIAALPLDAPGGAS
jgi:hypothetical protein